MRSVAATRPGQVWKREEASRTATIKFLVLVASLGLCLTVVRLSVPADYPHAMQRVAVLMRQAGIWAPVGFFVCAAVLTAVGVPRLLFAGIGGASFGLVAGFLWSQVATLVGAYLNFVYARWLGSALVRERLFNVHKFGQLFNEHPLCGVILIRQLPIGGLFVNSALGLTTVRHRTFLVGSLIGFFPEAIVVTLLASSAGTATREAFWWQLGSGLAAACVVAYAVWRIGRQSRLQRELESNLVGAEEDGGSGG